MDVLFPVNLVPLVALPVSLVALSRGGDLADLEGFSPSLAAGGSTGGWWVEKQALGNTVLVTTHTIHFLSCSRITLEVCLGDTVL